MKTTIFIVLFILLAFPNTFAQGLDMADATIVVRGVGMSEAYPNPAPNGEAFFDLHIPAGIQDAHLAVVSVIGATVWRERLQPGIYTKRVPLTGLNRGVYFYRLEVGYQKSSIYKLILH